MNDDLYGGMSLPINSPTDMPVSMDEASAAERVMSGGRTRALVYRNRIATLTPGDHREASGETGDRCAVAVEAAIAAACHLYRALDPHHSDRGRRPRAFVHAQQRYHGALQVLAALLGGLYPTDDQRQPLWEAEQLIQQRTQQRGSNKGQ